MFGVGDGPKNAVEMPLSLPSRWLSNSGVKIPYMDLLHSRCKSSWVMHAYPTEWKLGSTYHVETPQGQSIDVEVELRGGKEELLGTFLAREGTAVKNLRP